MHHNLIKQSYRVIILLLIVVLTHRLHANDYSEYRVKETLQQKYDDDIWVNAKKIIHTYDWIGNRIKITDYVWQREKWENDLEITYGYGSNKMVIYDFLSTQLIQPITYTYDDDGKIIKIETPNVCKGGVYPAINNLSYDLFGNLEESQNNSYSNNNDIISYHYVSNGNLLYVTATGYADRIYGLHECILTQSWLYLLHGGTNQLQQQIKPDGLDLNDFAPATFESNCNSRFIYYDDPTIIITNPVHDGKILEYRAAQLVDYSRLDDTIDVWKNYRRIYEYNATGKLIGDICTVKDSTVKNDTSFVDGWENYSRNTYFYDADNNCSTIIYEKWDRDNSVWINDTKLFYTYENLLPPLVDNKNSQKHFSSKSQVYNLSNFPNPFNNMTLIRFELEKSATVSLNLYDTTGELVKVLTYEQILPAGSHSFIWNGINQQGQAVASGIYLYLLRVESNHQMGRCLLIR